MAIVDDAADMRVPSQKNVVVTDRKMQGISISIIIVLAVLLALFPEQGQTTLSSVFKWMTNSFDFAFLGVGLKTMQTAAVLAGLPVIVILVFMMITTVKFIQQDNA